MFTLLWYYRPEHLYSSDGIPEQENAEQDGDADEDVVCVKQEKDSKGKLFISKPKEKTNVEEEEEDDDDYINEVYASRHRDSNLVATIEDKCYVLTYGEYCR